MIPNNTNLGTHHLIIDSAATPSCLPYCIYHLPLCANVSTTTATVVPASATNHGSITLTSSIGPLPSHAVLVPQMKEILISIHKLTKTGIVIIFSVTHPIITDKITQSRESKMRRIADWQKSAYITINALAIKDPADNSRHATPLHTYTVSSSFTPTTISPPFQPSTSGNHITARPRTPHTVLKRPKNALFKNKLKAH